MPSAIAPVETSPNEGDGVVGTVCIYEATSQEAIRGHASRAGLPADEIIPIVDTVLVRPDPVPADRQGSRVDKQAGLILLRLLA